MNDAVTIIGLGEVLWDVFPDARKFGGAPANFACSVAGLQRQGAEVYVVSGVGNDSLGREAITSLKEHRVDVSCVQVSRHPTGQVQVQIDNQGKASYEFLRDTAWDNLQWNEELRQLAGRSDAVCFGTLGQRSELSRATIERFVSATRTDSLRILDINLRPPFYDDAVILKSLELANVLKLNDDELPLLAQVCGLDRSDTGTLKELAHRYSLRCVALTRGADGALLLRDDELSDAPGVVTRVVDTVGAGDAYTAALAMGLLRDQPLEQINRHATQLAAFVCSQAGATPSIPLEIQTH